MANLTSVNIDPTVDAFSGGRKLLAAGWHRAVYASDELSDTKSGGSALRIDFVMIDEPNVGESVSDYLNIKNKSEACERMAQGKLKLICEIMGVQFPPQNTESMYGRPIDVILDVEDATSKLGRAYKRNVVSRLRPPTKKSVSEEEPQKNQSTEPTGW